MTYFSYTSICFTTLVVLMAGSARADAPDRPTHSQQQQAVVTQTVVAGNQANQPVSSAPLIGPLVGGAILASSSSSPVQAPAITPPPSLVTLPIIAAGGPVAIGSATGLIAGMIPATGPAPSASPSTSVAGAIAQGIGQVVGQALWPVSTPPLVNGRVLRCRLDPAEPGDSNPLVVNGRDGWGFSGELEVVFSAPPSQTLTVQTAHFGISTNVPTGQDMVARSAIKALFFNELDTQVWWGTISNMTDLKENAWRVCGIGAAFH